MDVKIISYLIILLISKLCCKELDVNIGSWFLFKGQGGISLRFKY